MKKWLSIKWLIPGFILLGILVLYVYNRPVKKDTVLFNKSVILPMKKRLLRLLERLTIYFEMKTNTRTEGGQV